MDLPPVAPSPPASAAVLEVTFQGTSTYAFLCGRCSKLYAVRRDTDGTAFGNDVELARKEAQHCCHACPGGCGAWLRWGVRLCPACATSETVLQKRREEVERERLKVEIEARLLRTRLDLAERNVVGLPERIRALEAEVTRLSDLVATVTAARDTNAQIVAGLSGVGALVALGHAAREVLDLTDDEDGLDRAIRPDRDVPEFQKLERCLVAANRAFDNVFGVAWRDKGGIDE